MTHFTSTASEFPPQDNALNLEVSDFIPPGDADEAFWLDFMGQQAVNESGGVLASSQFISTSHHNPARHGFTTNTSLNEPHIDTFDLGAMDFSDVNIGDVTTINDANHHDFSIDHEERSFGCQVPESNQTFWFDHITPHNDVSTSPFPAAVDTLGTSGPASLPLPVENPFVSASNHPSGPIDLPLNQDPWLRSLVHTNERTLSPCCHNTFGMSNAQQQRSEVLGALMVSPDLPGTTHCQQSSISFMNQEYDMDISSGLGNGADADADYFPCDSSYISTPPVHFDLPIRAVGFEHRRDSLRCISSYSHASSQHVNSSFGADRSCPGPQILGLESNQVVNNNHALIGVHQVPLDASSNSLVRYTNGAVYTAPASDVIGFSQGTGLLYSNATTPTPGATSSALPQGRRVKRKSVQFVHGPKRPSANGLRSRALLQDSGLSDGYSCLMMVLQGSNVKRSNARAGKPRTKNEQNARDRGVCPPCRKMKLGCVPNDPNDPYGPCQRCVTRYDGAMMHLRGYYLTACRRSFSDFSELLRPQLECRNIHRPLYLSCIRIGSMLDFLDLALTGPPSSQLTLATSLRVCMILATLHKFCSQTSNKIYSQFSKMALWYWSKACENLAGAYDMGMTAEDTFELLVQVAADFAGHLNQRAVNQGLPRGLLNTTVLNAELARQAWFGYETRELWYLSVDSRVPLRLPPALVTTIAGGLKALPGWLRKVSR
ncbi:hypothetical protein MBLNU13_g04717t1 [Cladosporium sp. NU13]